MSGESGVVANPGEDARNRLLRRVDWRFLLPYPNPSRVLCIGDPDLADALQMVSGIVSRLGDAGDTRDCDLAVVVEPDARSLGIAHASLRPGGCLYSESRRHRSGSGAELRRRLEAAGFEDVRLYWPHPDPATANPAAWIPLDGTGPLRHYFVENRGRSRTKWRRAVRTVLRSATAAAPRLGLARPICAIARKSGAGETNDPGIETLIRRRWDEWNLGPSPKSFSWLLLTGGLRSDSKVIALLFADSSARPVIALKMPRRPESAPLVERESRVLGTLSQRLGRSVPAGVPRLLFFEPHGDVLVLGETAFTGVPLLSAWTYDDYERVALHATDWLADLAGRPIPRPRREWWGRLVESVLHRFLDLFGRALEKSDQDGIEALLETLPPLPLVCEQRDFSPWNVLLTPEGGLAVVDWESAELDGLPALDLIYFLTYLCFSFDSARQTGRYVQSYRGMLDPATSKGSLAARCFSVYFDRLGMDPAALPALRVLTWLVHAGSEYGRLQSDFGPRPDLEVLRNAVCVQLCREELRRERA